METQNNKTLSLSKKIFVGSLAMAALISSLVSCGNNGGGGAPNVPAGSIYTNGIAGATACTACPGNDMIFTAKNGNGQATFTNMQLNLGAPNPMPGISSRYNTYSGPVSIQGTFVATTTLIDPGYGGGGSCAIPAGTYTIQTVSQGSLSYGLLQVPELISTSANIRMRVGQAMLYKDAMTNTTHMYGSVYVTSVNGVPCSSMFSDVFN